MCVDVELVCLNGARCRCFMQQNIDRSSTSARSDLEKKPKQRNLPHVCNDIDRKEQQRFNLDNSRSHKKGNHEKQSPDTHTHARVNRALLFAVSYVCLTIFSVHSNRPFWTRLFRAVRKKTQRKKKTLTSPTWLRDVLPCGRYGNCHPVGFRSWSALFGEAF